MAGRAIRGQPDPPSSCGLPDARLARRGRRRRTGVLASPQPLRTKQHREPGRMADHGGRTLCLDMLRSRKSRREESLETSVSEPITSRHGEIDPEQEALLADSVGLALLVVLDTLSPAERLAFVLHDIFAVPFDEIASIVERSETATRQLASRARRRVREDADFRRLRSHPNREVVDAFLTASHSGNFEALLTVLDPDVVFRHDRTTVPTGESKEVRGAASVARLVLRPCPGSAICSCKRICRDRRGLAWSAVPRPQSHNYGRKDRRDQCGRRPRTSPPTRSGSPGQLTSQQTDCCSGQQHSKSRPIRFCKNNTIP